MARRTLAGEERRRAPVGRDALRRRATAASRYVSLHRGGARKRARTFPVGRLVGFVILVGIGLLVAQRGANALVDGVASVGEGIGRMLPAPIVERARASNQPAALNAAPVLDGMDAFTNKPNVVVSGRVPSYVLGSSERPRIEIVVNDALAASPALDAQGRFSATVALVAGPNTIVVGAVRAAGRADAAARTVTLDVTPPSLTITKPSIGATIDGTNVFVQGKTDVGATVTVNGHAVGVGSDGAFSDTVPVQPGPVSFAVIARDQAGNTTTKTVAVTARPSGDTSAFAVGVALDHPLAKTGQTINADVWVIDAAASPVANVSLTVTAGLARVGSGTTDATGHFRFSFSAPSTEGIVQVVAVATSGALSGRGAAQLEVVKP